MTPQTGCRHMLRLQVSPCKKVVRFGGVHVRSRSLRAVVRHMEPIRVSLCAVTYYNSSDSLRVKRESGMFTELYAY